METELIVPDGLPSMTLSLMKLPLNITIDGKPLVPAEDITPRESVLLVMLLLCMSRNTWGLDYQAFITDNKLERHFKG